ncbi:MAG: TatD family hydrolase [Oscillospiraceae bacterium]|jgi:TatD DNase family protein
MYRGIIDTHAHMDDPCFAGKLDEVLASEKEKGVEMIIQSGSELPSSRRSAELAEKYDIFTASVGVYPNEAAGVPKNYIEILRGLASGKRVVAIGEIGMDFGYENHPPKDIQEKVFREQLSLASELGLPVVIHDRDADEDVIRILRDYPGVCGCIHRVFSQLKYTRIFLEMGLYMGIGPQITYPGGKKLKDLVREMPVDRIVFETDAPFLPTYGLGKVDAVPSMIADAAEAAAGIRGDITPQELILEARGNARRLFSLPIPEKI